MMLALGTEFLAVIFVGRYKGYFSVLSLHKSPKYAHFPLYSFLNIYFSNTISTSFVLIIGQKGEVTY